MSARLRSPVKRFGGKGAMVASLLPLLPPHRVYAEPFGGAASLLFAKRRAPVEVYNDIDSGLVNFFRVLRDPAKAERLRELADLTPYSREEWRACTDTWEACADDVERAHRWFVAVRQSFNGEPGNSWSYSRDPGSDASRTYRASVSRFAAVTRRLEFVQVENRDFRILIPAFDTPETLFYCDPPYVAETRRSHGYAHEMTADDHADLVSLLLGLEGAAVVSGYAYPLYEPLERAGWERRDFEVACDAAGRTRATGILGDGAAFEKQPRVETVWIKPVPHLTRQGVLFAAAEVT